MKYFDCYELIYQNALKTNRSIEQKPSSIIEFLKQDVLSRVPISDDGFCHALDVGCGTRVVFDHLNEPPFKAKGIDISNSAIELARKSDSKAEYECMDISKLEEEQKYDLIVDSHCLHCLIGDEQRSLALQNIYNALKPGGVFALETMTEHKKMEFEENYHFDLNTKVLHRHVTNAQFEDLVFFEGRPYLPTRKINHAREIEEEILSTGFQIIFLYIFSNLKVIPDETRTHPLPSDPDLLRTICLKK